MMNNSIEFYLVLLIDSKADVAIKSKLLHHENASPLSLRSHRIVSHGRNNSREAKI
jgi:hypothetical protein